MDGDVSSVEALLMGKGNDGQISLREAIIATNATMAVDTILFAVDGTFGIATAPGTGDDSNSKGDFDIQIEDDALVVRGEKRFERESTEGRWRVLQCAFGHFQRNVPLPAAVVADAARASYRDGVLRIEMPKQQRGRPRVTRVAVH